MSAAVVYLHPNAGAQPVQQPKGRRGRYPREVVSLGQKRRQSLAESAARANEASMQRARQMPRPSADPHDARGWRIGQHNALADAERQLIDDALALLTRQLRDFPVFDAPAAMGAYLRLQLAAEPRELFAVAFLDSQHRLIEFQVMFIGTVAQTAVYPREVVRAAIAHNASAVVLAHNHPSGMAEPSMADESLTYTLKQALSLVDVRVLDHFIVTASECRSMAAMGFV